MTTIPTLLRHLPAARAIPRPWAGSLAGALVAGALALAGCGSAARSPSGSTPSRVVAPIRAQPVSIALDFTPNPAHAPLYLAARDGFDRRFGVALRIRQPGNGPDSLKLLLGGRVDIGVLDIDDLGLARARGADVVAVAALVQRPLGALIAQPYIHAPAALAGRRVGVSGLPSDPAFLRAILSREGVPLRRLRLVTIGFNAVAQMIAGNIAAVPAFWSDEGVALRLRGLPVREFRIDRFGAPEYPEVVLCVTGATLRRRPHLIQRALAAIALGARAAVAHPAQATAVIAAAAGGGDARLIAAQTRTLAPALSPPLTLDRGAVERWSSFSARTRLLPGPVDVPRAFDFSLAPAALRLARLNPR